MRGSMLKEILQEQGISISELARRLNVSAQTLYSMVKRDNQKVDFDMMMHICKLLNVPVERLCEDNALPKMPDLREWQFIGKYRRMSESSRKLVDMVIDHELSRREEKGSAADFAVRIAGDSMEPYIHDGDVALCKRGAIIHDGDIGLFFVDGDMKCKQYCQDYSGNVYLFSANRDRSDADVTVPASSGITLMCFGKVLLDKSIPLPEMR